MPSAQSDSLALTLARALPDCVQLDVDLTTISRWRVGGRASAVVRPRTVDHVALTMQISAQWPDPTCIIGEGSNLLFDSAGFDGVVVLIGQEMSSVTISDTTVVALAGTSVPHLAHLVADAGLSGIEHTVGIPGTIGGLVLMNGGSQRKGIGSHVTSVKCVDSTGAAFDLTRSECEFGYRSSRLQKLGAAVVEVTLDLRRDDPDRIRSEMTQILDSRRRRFPHDLPSCGSTFLSDPAMYSTVGAPGDAIERAGLKGLRRGDAQISPMHANFFVNLGNATSDDILWLIAHARRTVERMTGFAMDCEVRHVSSSGSIRPAHIAAEELWSVQETEAALS